MWPDLTPNPFVFKVGLAFHFHTGDQIKCEGILTAEENSLWQPFDLSIDLVFLMLTPHGYSRLESHIVRLIFTSCVVFII